ncbi:MULTISPECIES: ATP-dependent helicase HrpB [Pseudonocardia]|uniref:ATP-dependent RNA helicase HrpB n=2 Tax=Pseudonocardia TaxID=1847 RepID=A0A1Y2N5Y6_PSEAH|nr:MULTISPECIES: ATP-dependent helicase HrpB [Pseudonocardia]OSY42872.1 ATP-dependent RNA helicase HrpB [Pseudonocardia autotrophica]TDN77450.1 ATP-dependent helicase HrpB [Pseudonocardia autotrophica]BBG01472.1 ATP-dependent helicase [Pseudonocardia autotrophica]GEC25256.1 ATP-dependent helicase [Pseudonocardia saturnea]
MVPPLPDLPVAAVLEDLRRALDQRGSCVLVAPPGTGKTTLVPLALAGLPTGTAPSGRVLVAEPRRVAARAAAARMSSLLGTPVGGTVGYRVRGDSRTGPDTRVEVVTSGLLLRRLAADPELAGVSTVVLDEVHERHLDADLLLTLLLDARDGLRPDLRLLATSATLDATRPAALLGGTAGPAPVLEVAARTYDVALTHVPPARGERIEATVARTAVRALEHGSVLAFLPGVAEIGRVAAALRGRDLDADVLPLHGRLPASEQDAALREGPRPRIVLSTAVAESSLTVPGVRAVVDSGLTRVPHVDHRRGLAGLVTRRVSRAVATQRAGRAGREAPGTAYRCWPDGEGLADAPEPEIRIADLTGLALDLAVWGTPDGSGLRWWDEPPSGPLAAGRAVLTALGALDAGGNVTARGRRIGALGLHPRLARALLDGVDAGAPQDVAGIVAVLDDDTLAGPADDLAAALARLRSGEAPGARRWRGERDRLARTLQRTGGTGPHRDRVPGTELVALVTGLAHPERLARRRDAGSGVYLMAGGTAVEVPPGPLRDAEWLAVAVADRRPGEVHGRVRLAAATDRETAERAGAALLVTGTEVAWDAGDVRARSVHRLGAIVLTERPDPRPGRDAVRAALVTGLRSEGTGLLRWTASASSLRERLGFLHRVLGDPWPEVTEEALLASAEDPAGWLAGPLATARRRADLARVDAGQALRAYVAAHVGGLAGRIDELAPERLAVPSGSRIALDYSGDAPALPVRVQEVFGWTGSPAVAGGRVPVVLHLLSPAGRPAAVTADLPSFWATGYPQVRAELRGRYPKHAWPEDPRTAVPGRGTGRRR